MCCEDERRLKNTHIHNFEWRKEIEKETQTVCYNGVKWLMKRKTKINEEEIRVEEITCLFCLFFFFRNTGYIRRSVCMCEMLCSGAAVL